MAVVTILSYRGKNIVWPPYVVVKPGEEVVFKCVNTEASVFLPRPEVFTVPVGAGPTSTASGITLGISGSPGAAKIKVKGQAVAGSAVAAAANPAPGIYPYTIYCKNGNDFAEGNSSPVMIIEPPDPVVPISDGISFQDK